MTISNLQRGFDEYSRKARLYPGLIAAAPLIVAATLFLPREPMLTVAGIAASVGVVFFLANFVRSLGKNLEKRLIQKWGGFPTTKMLRHRQPQNAALFERRRRKLEQLYGEQLPTRVEESAHPDRADETYIAATRFLIVRVNEQRADFPRVHEENISYGFARNLLGLKLIAITAALLAIAVDCVVAWMNGFDFIVAAVLAIHLVLLVVWIFFVRTAWVLQAGQTYAERLFETLDSSRLQGSSRGKR